MPYPVPQAVDVWMGGVGRGALLNVARTHWMGGTWFYVMDVDLATGLSSPSPSYQFVMALAPSAPAAKYSFTLERPLLRIHFNASEHLVPMTPLCFFTN